MNKEEFDSILEEVLKHGIAITLRIGQDGIIWYDMNTLMKSGLQIALIDNICKYQERYVSGTINDINELLYNVKYCMCSRGYGSPDWLDWLEKEGLLKKTVTTTTTTTYSYK